MFNLTFNPQPSGDFSTTVVIHYKESAVHAAAILDSCHKANANSNKDYSFLYERKI